MKARLACIGAMVVIGAHVVLSQTIDSVSRMTLLLFGDVNLGRNLGKELLKGRIDYPFKNVAPLLHSADAVFANLESQLTDQHGETESPKSNYIFCGPPEGARALRVGGITIVSTANNHAFDYALSGLQETIGNLDREGIRHVGTSSDSVRYFQPAVIRKRGISVGFLAYAEFVNGPVGWEGRISVFDSVRARKEIRRLKSRVDFVIVSFHGGTEYGEEPRPLTLRRMRSLIDAGADIVVGHHPHVPQGIGAYHGKLIFYSLGNFVFNQSDLWAKRSFGVSLVLRKIRGRTAIETIRLIPIRVYQQPVPELPALDTRELVDRLKKASTATIDDRRDSIFVTLPQMSQIP